MTKAETPFTAWLGTKGITNWVVASRVTDRLRGRYGADVQAISQKRFRELDRQYEIETAASHPALSDVRAALYAAVCASLHDKGTVDEDDAAMLIAALRKNGWRIEPVHSERKQILE